MSFVNFPYINFEVSLSHISQSLRVFTICILPKDQHKYQKRRISKTLFLAIFSGFNNSFYYINFEPELRQHWRVIREVKQPWEVNRRMPSYQFFICILLVIIFLLALQYVQTVIKETCTLASYSSSPYRLKIVLNCLPK